VVELTRGVVESLTVSLGAKGLVRLVHHQASGRWVCAIKGTGSFSAGLTTFLLEQGKWAVEIDRPQRPAIRNRAKSDELDVLRAAREALSRQHLAQPRTLPLVMLLGKHGPHQADDGAAVEEDAHQVASAPYLPV